MFAQYDDFSFPNSSICANSSGGGFVKKSAPRFHAVASAVEERNLWGVNGLQGDKVDERDLLSSMGDGNPDLTHSD